MEKFDEESCYLLYEEPSQHMKYFLLHYHLESSFQPLVAQVLTLGNILEEQQRSCSRISQYSHQERDTIRQSKVGPINQLPSFGVTPNKESTNFEPHQELLPNQEGAMAFLQKNALFTPPMNSASTAKKPPMS